MPRDSPQMVKSASYKHLNQGQRRNFSTKWYKKAKQHDVSWVKPLYSSPFSRSASTTIDGDRCKHTHIADGLQIIFDTCLCQFAFPLLLSLQKSLRSPTLFLFRAWLVVREFSQKRHQVWLQTWFTLLWAPRTTCSVGTPLHFRFAPTQSSGWTSSFGITLHRRMCPIIR